MRAWRRSTLALVALGSSASCQPPGGPLSPIKEPHIEVVERSSGEKAARLQSELVAIEITGDWRLDDNEVFIVEIRNDGGQPVRLPTNAFRLRHKGEAAQVGVITDLTGVSLADADPNNDEPAEIYAMTRGGRKPVLEVPARGQRELEVVFHGFKRLGNKLGDGDEMTLEVPLQGAASERVRFLAD